MTQGLAFSSRNQGAKEDIAIFSSLRFVTEHHNVTRNIHDIVTNIILYYITHTHTHTHTHIYKNITV